MRDPELDPGRAEHGARPPALASRLFALLLPDEYRDAVLGDLAEGFDRRRREARSAASAHLWYWREIIHVDVLTLRAEAKAAARRDGGGGDMIGVLLAELRQALRIFRRSPGFVAAVLATLAVGIGGATSIFSLVDGLLLRPIPGVRDQASLVAVQASERGGAFGASSFMDYLDFTERSRSFEALAAFKARRVDASANGASEPLAATMVTSSYFDVLGVGPHVGRYFGTEADVGPGAHPEVVLTDGLWQRWFAGDPDALGTTLVLNGRSYTVVGVTPPGFRGTSLVEVPDLFVPMTMQAELMPESGYLLDRRGWGGVSIVGRLAAGVPRSAADAEVAAIAARLGAEYPDTNAERTYAVTGFRAAALPEDARAGVVQMSALLLSIVVALWLVVCLNVANLFLARSMKRRRELAVRLAMGAGRRRVVVQLTLEFMAIAVAAGVVGMALARAVAAMVAALPLPVLIDGAMDGATVLFAGSVAVVTGLLCAFVPALTLSGTDPRTVASPGSGLRPSGQRWPSRILIVGQVTLSVVLLFTTGLFVRTLSNLNSADPGFDASDLLTAELNPSLQGYDEAAVADFYERLTLAAASIPGVEAAALADALPADGNFGRDGWYFENAREPERPSSLFLGVVSANYFRTLGIPVLEGRDFGPDDRVDQLPTLVMNQAAARLIELRTDAPAIGQGLSISGPGGPFLEVVGVVGDIRTGRASEAAPFVFGLHAQVLAAGLGGERMVVMLKTSVPPESLGPALRSAVAAVDPNVSTANLMTMDRFLAELLAADRLTVGVLGVSSTLALLLVAVGLYGLLAYVVAQRTREFGIRMALGAAGKTLKAIVLREALLLAGVGLLLGSVGALAVTRLIDSFLVGVSSTDPGSIAASVATVVAVTLAAAHVPASRATRADPVVAMRSE